MWLGLLAAVALLPLALAVPISKDPNLVEALLVIGTSQKPFPTADCKLVSCTIITGICRYQCRAGGRGKYRRSTIPKFHKDPKTNQTRWDLKKALAESPLLMSLISPPFRAEDEKSPIPTRKAIKRPKPKIDGEKGKKLGGKKRKRPLKVQFVKKLSLGGKGTQSSKKDGNKAAEKLTKLAHKNKNKTNPKGEGKNKGGGKNKAGVKNKAGIKNKPLVKDKSSVKNKHGKLAGPKNKHGLKEKSDAKNLDVGEDKTSEMKGIAGKKAMDERRAARRRRKKKTSGRDRCKKALMATIN